MQNKGTIKRIFTITDVVSLDMGECNSIPSKDINREDLPSR